MNQFCSDFSQLTSKYGFFVRMASAELSHETISWDPNADFVEKSGRVSQGLAQLNVDDSSISRYPDCKGLSKEISMMLE